MDFLFPALDVVLLDEVRLDLVNQVGQGPHLQLLLEQLRVDGPVDDAQARLEHLVLHVLVAQAVRDHADGHLVVLGHRNELRLLFLLETHLLVSQLLQSQFVHLAPVVFQRVHKRILGRTGEQLVGVGDHH